MNYPAYCWIDVAFGGPQNRNKLVDIRKKLKLPDKPVDCYRTVYRYPEAMREHFKLRKTVSGYDGMVYADFFPVDIDSPKLEDSLERARLVLKQLAVRFDVDLEAIRCFFSGAKGFHILLPAEMFGLTPDKRIPAAFKELSKTLFDDVPIDPVIYDTVRLFRLSNTINSKTGLYKIPLTASEVLHGTLEEILETAKAPRSLDYLEEIAPNEALVEVYRKALEALSKTQWEVPSEPGEARDRFQKRCIVRLLEGVGEGERNNAALRLAVHFLRHGLVSDMVLAVLERWNARNDPPMKPDELRRTVESAGKGEYDFGCKDPVLSALCDSKCYLRKQAEAERRGPSIKSITDAYTDYLEYIKSLRTSKVMLGIKPIDDLMRGIAPGEVCQVLARSAVGKTTLLLNLLKNISEAGTGPVLFFTLEMPLAQLFERMCQIACGYTGFQVESLAKAMVDGKGERAMDDCGKMASRVFGAYGEVYFVDRDGLSLEDIYSVHGEATAMTGKRIALIALDYMGRMEGGFGPAYEQTSRLAKGLKKLAKDKDVAVLSLHQVSRAGGDGSLPISLEMGRDSGVIEEAADAIIAMWRPDKGSKIKDPEERVIVALLKNRRGRETQTELVFRKASLRMEVT